MKFWTGVGSREITEQEADYLYRVSYHLALFGYVLRSGGAPGSDMECEDGVYQAAEDYPGKVRQPFIFGPWNNWDNSVKQNRAGDYYPPTASTKEDLELARYLISTIHPAFDRLSRGAFLLQRRNMFQPLGLTLDEPSEFLLACSDTDKFGIPKGGTRSAWVLAERYGIPCFNIRGKTLYEIESFIGSITSFDERIL